jgi:hypothetical protein
MKAIVACSANALMHQLKLRWYVQLHYVWCVSQSDCDSCKDCHLYTVEWKICTFPSSDADAINGYLLQTVEM